MSIYYNTIFKLTETYLGDTIRTISPMFCNDENAIEYFVDYQLFERLGYTMEEWSYKSVL